MGRSQLLEEWIDGATICKESSAVGFAWSLYQDCLHFFAELVPLVSKSFSTASATAVLNEEVGRLFSWGDGFENGELDRTLDRDPELKNTTLEYLSSLGTLLTNKLFLVPTFNDRGGKSNFEAKALELRSLISNVRTVIDESEDDESDLESEFGGSLSSQKSILDEIASDIKFYNLRLMDLLPSIERTASEPKDIPESKTAPTSIDSVPFQVSEPAHAYVLQVRDKFPKADSKLIERLGEANWQRRIRIREDTLEDIEAVISDTAKSIFIPVSMFHDSGLGNSVPNQSTYAPTAISHSSFQTTASESKLGSYRVPPTPKEVFDGIPFTCEICGHVLKKIKNRADWKIHVFADLKPYICTSQTCTDELCTFPTRQLWADHEFRKHRVERTWRCYLCPTELSSPQFWDEHMKQIHEKHLIPGDLQKAIHLAEFVKEMPIQSQKCPMCMKSRMLKQKEFISHVARHMEGIALAALPRDVDSESGSDAEKGSNSFERDAEVKSIAPTATYSSEPTLHGSPSIGEQPDNPFSEISFMPEVENVSEDALHSRYVGNDAGDYRTQDLPSSDDYGLQAFGTVIDTKHTNPPNSRRMGNQAESAMINGDEHKPFLCPVIGCEKAYKTQNGLKYHKTHGHQNQTLHENGDGTFSIVNPETSAPYAGTLGMEKKKPYKCDVCGKRYKNLNGLKYHKRYSTMCNMEIKPSGHIPTADLGGRGGESSRTSPLPKSHTSMLPPPARDQSSYFHSEGSGRRAVEDDLRLPPVTSVASVQPVGLNSAPHGSEKGVWVSDGMGSNQNLIDTEILTAGALEAVRSNAAYDVTSDITLPSSIAGLPPLVALSDAEGPRSLFRPIISRSPPAHSHFVKGAENPPTRKKRFGTRPGPLDPSLMKMRRYRACDECRLRKAWCEGSSGPCTRCQKWKIDCSTTLPGLIVTKSTITPRLANPQEIMASEMPLEKGQAVQFEQRQVRERHVTGLVQPRTTAALGEQEKDKDSVEIATIGALHDIVDDESLDILSGTVDQWYS